MLFHESFMEGEVSWIFQGCFMIFKVVFRVFQGGFKKTLKVFQKNFYVAWHPSQLPEQKESLLILHFMFFQFLFLFCFSFFVLNFLFSFFVFHFLFLIFHFY